MIEIKPQGSAGTVEIWVHGKLEAADFQKAASVLDPMIAEQGKLKGLLVCIDDFQGWDHLHSFFAHVNFVKEHQRHIERIAAVGNKKWEEVIPKLASLFVEAEPRYFDIKEIDKARAWIAEKR